VMASFKDESCKNDPSVSSEYVKFLIMNTGMDVVDQLSKKVTLLDERVPGLIKEVKIADAKAATASNNASIASKAVEALTRRIAALESKK
jgi:hypothetical protein